MKTNCPKCDAPALSEGGPHNGPRWVEFSCGSVFHQADSELVEHNSCLRRQLALYECAVAALAARLEELEEIRQDEDGILYWTSCGEPVGAVKAGKDAT